MSNVNCTYQVACRSKMKSFIARNGQLKSIIDDLQVNDANDVGTDKSCYSLCFNDKWYWGFYWLNLVDFYLINARKPYTCYFIWPIHLLVYIVINLQKGSMFQDAKLNKIVELLRSELKIDFLWKKFPYLKKFWRSCWDFCNLMFLSQKF